MSLIAKHGTRQKIKMTIEETIYLGMKGEDDVRDIIYSVHITWSISVYFY